MTRIEVKDFGPIAEGAVDLKPLTVFIGPNNSGQVVYGVAGVRPFAGYGGQDGVWVARIRGLAIS